MCGSSAILMLFLFFGCVSDYTPKGMKEVNGILVVDGFITNGESAFTLQKSVGISDKTWNAEIVDNALLEVECSDGTHINGQYEGEGKYVVPMGDLNPQLEYRLNFSIGEEIYQSDYLTPLVTVDMDSISYTKKGPGEPVYICVSTHDPDNNSPYYRWTYNETWEVKASLYADAYQLELDGPVFYYDLKSSNNVYYCWGRKSSNSFLLESTEKLSENRVQQKKLIEIPCNDDKLSVLYHVAVTQVQIRKEAYQYYNVLRNTAERTGGLFSPVLSAGLDGNVRCATDPDIPIIGYVDVSTSTKQERYVQDRKIYEPINERCIGLNPVIYHTYPWYVYGEYKAEPRCIDCRLKPNASKDKPDWWPTTHL